MVVGTSICDLVIDQHEVRMPGITGVVEDGILPGFFGYEAGQAAVGDMFAWFGSRLLGLEKRRFRRESSWHEEFEQSAARIAPGSERARRSRLVERQSDDPRRRRPLGGHRRPHARDDAAEIYRALLESVAFGTRRIIENFVEHDVAVDEIVACGGIAERSALMMQLLADVTGLPSRSPTRATSRHAARHCSAPSPRARRRADSTTSIRVAELQAGDLSSLRASPRRMATYDEVYSVFRSLHDEFGREHVEWLHHLEADPSLRLGDSHLVDGPFRHTGRY